MLVLVKAGGPGALLASNSALEFYVYLSGCTPNAGRASKSGSMVHWLNGRKGGRKEGRKEGRSGWMD